MYGRNLTFSAETISIAYLGIVDVEGKGHSSGTGNAAGASDAVAASGGSYGGAGGLDPAQPFDGTLYQADQFGSGGGISELSV